MRIALPLCAFLSVLTIAFLVDALEHSVKPVQIVLHHTGFMLNAPATARISARIHPIASDRCVVILCDGPDYYRRSVVPIEGDTAPALVPNIPVECRDMPPGQYGIFAGIGPDWEGDCELVRARDDVQMTVIGAH